MNQEAIGEAKVLLGALVFAAKKHSRQRRKDSEATPYINHPIAVAEILTRIGRVRDVDLIQAAILHDTVEDTQTTFQELDELFGNEVCLLVRELSDDKNLPKDVRKKLEIEHAPFLSDRAKLIKVADKICNLGDITIDQPTTWPLHRKLEYISLAEKVVLGCRGCNDGLDHYFDALLDAKRKEFHIET
jgi:guanosine-3',5'-bis(diphosphate) 3'-pyrophosphohydrolase